MPSNAEYIAIEQKYYAQTVRRRPVVIVRGEGSRVWDADGKEYIDFVAGWAVDNLGHCPPVVVDAIAQQAATLIQTSNQFYTLPQLDIAAMLIDNSCMDRVFFCNSGAEAVEGALKLARRYGKLHKNGAYEVITAFNSFHGRTMNAVAATGQPHYHELFEPIPEGFTYVDFNDVEAVMNATTENTVAVMVEPVQGEGGVNIPDDDYFQRLRAWCDQNDILLILDEVQTGMGRLGSLFGHQEYDVEPDVMILAKGLGYGVPIGAFLSKENAMALTYGDHGSTFGGNALTTAAAAAGTRYLLDNDVLGNVKRMEVVLNDRLNGLKARYGFVEEIRCKGLLAAVQFDSDIMPAVMDAAEAAGVLLNGVRPNAVRIMPALNITEDEIDEGVNRLSEALGNV